MKRFTPEPSETPVLTPGEVIAFLALATHPLSIREIASRMELKHAGRRMLPRVLEKLERKGEVEKVHSGKFRLPGKLPSSPEPQRTEKIEAQRQIPRDLSQFEGRLITHRDGFGFVVLDRPISGLSGDVYIHPAQMGDAMHGDRVLARVECRRADGRAEGRILRVLRREQTTVVGLFRYDSRGNFVSPYDVRLPQEIIIPPGEEIIPSLREKMGGFPAVRGKPSRGIRLPELEGAVVNVEVTRFPRSGVAPAGRIVEILGKPGELGVDVEIIVRKHHLPHSFSLPAESEAQAIGGEITESDLAGRTDFRNLPIVTIDGETARDFDDAVFVRALPDGGFELQVHIADVAHYVRPGSALDNEARLRGTSVYFPDRAIPMLPEKLSNGICSLNPRSDRLVMSVCMRMDSEGRRVGSKFLRGVIRSAERMTYTAVNAVLEDEAEATRLYAPLAGEFRRMRDLAILLNRLRAERGAIDFDLPEAVLQLDEAGRMTGIVRSERNMAHRIIEEFMLAANEAVAEMLDGRSLAFLHRVHEKPDPQKVLEFEELAHSFGYSLGVEELLERRPTVRHGTSETRGQGARGGHGHPRRMVVRLADSAHFDIRPEHYQRLAQKIAGRPEERIVSYLMLRSLKQARYAADALGHFALNTRHYVHFTSPIRRYPDLIVHRVLKWALAHPEPMESRTPASGSMPPGPYPRSVIDQMAAETSEAERRADAAERELMDWKTAQFMESHLGEEFSALIISVQKFGFFVELMEFFVEGLVPIDRLEEIFSERFLYRERDHALAGQRSRRAFRLGDRAAVRAERVDPIFHRVEFAVLNG